MWFKGFYNCLLFLLFLCFLPRALYLYFFKKKYKQSLAAKLGIKNPSIVNGSRPLVWIHAVSVGETKAIVNLAKKIKEELPDISLLISSGTETGHREAKKSIPFADHFIFLPFDFSWTMKKMVKLARPKWVIISETDLWLNFLSEAKAAGAQVAVVNAKISERTQKRFKRFSDYSKRLLCCIDYWLVQSSDYYQRFKELGIQENKMTIVGNLKLDFPIVKMTLIEKNNLQKRLGIREENFVITLGSTHAGEEEALIEKIWTLKAKYHQIKILVVPRHPERFDTVFQNLKRHFIDVDLFSTLTLQNPSQHALIVIDAMGVLKKCYEISSLAIVCGSYVKHIGGHNLLEPCYFAIPVIFGPYLHAQPELARLAIASQAGKIVPMEELTAVIKGLIERPLTRKKIGERGLQLIESNKGATERCWKNLQSAFGKPK